MSTHPNTPRIKGRYFIYGDIVVERDKIIGYHAWPLGNPRSADYGNVCHFYLCTFHHDRVHHFSTAIECTPEAAVSAVTAVAPLWRPGILNLPTCAFNVDHISGIYENKSGLLNLVTATGDSIILMGETNFPLLRDALKDSLSPPDQMSYMNIQWLEVPQQLCIRLHSVDAYIYDDVHGTLAIWCDAWFYGFSASSPAELQQAFVANQTCITGAAEKGHWGVRRNACAGFSNGSFRLKNCPDVPMNCHLFGYCHEALRDLFAAQA